MHRQTAGFVFDARKSSKGLVLSNEVSIDPLIGSDDLLAPRTEKKAWRDWLLLGGGCLLMAAILRFMRVGYREFFGAEFITLDILNGDAPAHGFEGWLRGYQSIYYLLLSGWAAFTGAITETLLRLPSAVIGLCTWVAFYFFARSYLRGSAFVLCILFFALNPILISTSIEATPFALVALMTVLANHFAIRALDENTLQNWGIYAALLIVGALVHPLFLFVPLSHFVFSILRGRRTPRVFLNLSWVFIALSLLFAAIAAAYVSRGSETVAVETPSASDFVKNVSALAVGNFLRFGANDFIRTIMVLCITACLALSYMYYHKRTAEARALPENVVWIDETLDVVGRWKHMSLRGFLLFHWFTFLVPAFCVLIVGAIMPGLRLRPEFFIIALPSLIVLLAMGIDAAPRSAMPSLGLLIVLAMIFYDVRVLSDRGYGIKEAFSIIRKLNYNPATDVVIYTHPNELQRGVRYYSGSISPVPIGAADRMRDFYARQARLEKVVEGKRRAMILFHQDEREIGPVERRSPVREWFRDARNGFERVDDGKYRELSEAEQTELQVYRRRTSEESASEGIPPAAPIPTEEELQAADRQTSAAAGAGDAGAAGTAP